MPWSRALSSALDGRSVRTRSKASPAAVAARLHISRDAVYHWIDHGHLPARRGPGGRYYIRFTAEDEAACRQRIATSSQLPSKIKAQALQSVPGGAL